MTTDKIIDAEFVDEGPRRPARTDGEQIAVELANFPRAIVGEVVERVRRRFPERGRVIDRAGKAIDDTIVRLADVQRGPPLSRSPK